MPEDTTTATTTAADTTAASTTASTTSEDAWSWVNAEGKLNDGWLDRMPEEDRAHGEEFAKFVNKYGASLPQILKGARNLQSVAGKRLTPPGADWTPEQVAEYRKGHGVPDAADAYDLTPPEGALPEGVEWNQELFKGLKEWAHKSHVPAAALKEMTGVLASVDKARQQAAIEMIQANDNKVIEDLKKEWGAQNYEGRLDKATRAAKALGISADIKDNPIANHPQFIKLLDRVAQSMGEDKLIQAGGGNATESIGKTRGMSIIQNKSDPLYAAYHGENGYDEQMRVQKMVLDLMADAA